MDENNYLISVTQDGKVVELYYSSDLRELSAIRAMHQGCYVESMKLKEPAVKLPEYVSEGKRNRLSRNGKPWANRVQCVETGEIWPSVVDCSKATGVALHAIYKSIHKGYNASGCHFSLIPPEEGERDQESSF